MKTADRKKKLFRLVMPLFVMFIAALPGKKVCAADGTSEYAPLIWQNNLSPDYMAVGKNGKRNDDPFAGKLEDGGALWIGIRNATLSTVFDKISYISTFENRDNKDKANAETEKPMVVKNPEVFRITVKRPLINLMPDELIYYFTLRERFPGCDVLEAYRLSDSKEYYLNGVIFDLYTYDGERIGCNPTPKSMLEIAENEFFPASMTSGERQYIRENLKERQYGDYYHADYRYFQVGPKLSMPQDYCFALVDCNAFDTDEYYVLPVIGKVTRDEAGTITNFEIISQFSVIENEKYGSPYACWPERASLFKYSEYVYEMTIKRSYFQMGPELVDLIHEYEVGLNGWKDRIVLKASKKIEYVTEYDENQTIEITGDTELNNTMYVKSGSKLIVKSGATFTVNGTIVNQGLITVEKGALMVVGTKGGITSINPNLPEKEQIRDHGGKIYVYGDLVELHGGYITLAQSLDGEKGGIMVEGGTFIADGYVSLGSYCQVKGNGQLQIEKEATFLVGIYSDRPYKSGDAETFEKLFTTSVLRMVDDNKIIFRNLLSYLAKVEKYEVEGAKKESFNKDASAYHITYDSFMSLINQIAQYGWGFNLSGELSNNSGVVEIKGYNMFVKIYEASTGLSYRTVAWVDY